MLLLLQYVTFITIRYFFYKVAAGEGKSVYFPIVPITLGNMELVVSAQSSMAADGVRRQLLVEVSYFRQRCFTVTEQIILTIFSVLL